MGRQLQHARGCHVQLPHHHQGRQVVHRAGAGDVRLCQGEAQSHRQGAVRGESGGHGCVSPPRTSCTAGCCCCPDICCMLFKAPITFICSMSWWLSSMAWTNLCGDLYIGRSSSGMSIPVHFTTAFFILSKEVFIMFSPKQDSMALCSAHCFCIFFIPNMSSPARATPTQIKIMKDFMMFWWYVCCIIYLAG